MCRRTFEKERRSALDMVRVPYIDAVDQIRMV